MFRSYYEILEVDRDATAAEINACYRRLASRHHPDKNPGNAYAAAHMLDINEAYEWLSDVAKRALYDAQLDAATPKATPQEPVQPTPAPEPIWEKELRKRARGERWRPFMKVVPTLIIFTIMVMSYFRVGEPQYSSAPKAVAAAPSPQTRLAPAPTRSMIAQLELKEFCLPQAKSPSGRAWPSVAGYLGKTPSRSKGGSTFTIDNTSSSHGIYVKLEGGKSPNSYARREVFVPGGRLYGVSGLDAGVYYVRHKDVASGCIYSAGPIRVDGVGGYDATKATFVKTTVF
ncbi:hypothetical protein HNP46_006516 [Pseudomonas nitritireducens]|uniref:J domain-containing protein n=1 Tax=Pseudomonas nitroreducens TaxID=46680 RepID=A0A7W7KRM9_PSENT|nr:DnaJ domain-containing protein [Pseudomonas nitritireducens]MBB4867602.1 hypothetical protein [Pseudomonas nitritireducens]